MLVLDALEVKMVPDPWNLEEASDNVQGFDWDILDFTETTLTIKLRFDNPRDVGAFQSEDYISVTFWGTHFFKSAVG